MIRRTSTVQRVRPKDDLSERDLMPANFRIALNPLSVTDCKLLISPELLGERAQKDPLSGS